MPPDFEDPLAEKLFDAARRERPSPAARERTARVVGSRARVRRKGAVKLAWAGGLAALAAGAALVAWPREVPTEGISAERVEGGVGREVAPRAARESGETPLREAAARAEASTLRAQPAASASVARSAAPPVAPVGTAPSSAPPTAAPKPPFLTQSEEFALVDRARELTVAGSPAHALAELDRYDRTPSARGLAAEATLLRIEALAATGRSAEAARLAERFVAQHPNSPLTDRARSFVARPSASPASSTQGTER